ncbi:MAG: D-amino-acid transaminase [Alphaproteobacteria bacterium]
MFRIAYVNGRYCRYGQAAVHIEDRCYQFADGVYEVTEVYERAFIDEVRHIDRLERSLAALDIPMPVTRAALALIMREVASRNRVICGSVYLQVTRGVASRDHCFPPAGTPPALVVVARPWNPDKADREAAKGIGVMTTADERWARVDIKSIGLLPNVLARQKAREKGADDVWLVDAEGYITEGAANTVWIVTGDKRLVTRPNGHELLPGVTRSSLETIAIEAGYAIEYRKFTVPEAQAAREAFITSASAIVTPVIAIDLHPVGDGKPGKTALDLRTRLRRSAPRTSL